MRGNTVRDSVKLVSGGPLEPQKVKDAERLVRVLGSLNRATRNRRPRHNEIDWSRLLNHMEVHWEVLLMHLLNFRYIYPSDRDLVPRWLMDELLDRLSDVLHAPLAPGHLAAVHLKPAAPGHRQEHAALEDTVAHGGLVGIDMHACFVAGDRDVTAAVAADGPALELAAAVAELRARDKTPFHISVAVSPFKYQREDLLYQYLKLEKKIAAGADMATITEQVAHGFAQVGVKMEIRPVPWPQMVRHIKNVTDALSVEVDKAMLREREVH